MATVTTGRGDPRRPISRWVFLDRFAAYGAFQAHAIKAEEEDAGDQQPNQVISRELGKSDHCDSEQEPCRHQCIVAPSNGHSSTSTLDLLKPSKYEVASPALSCSTQRPSCTSSSSRRRA